MSHLDRHHRSDVFVSWKDPEPDMEPIVDQEPQLHLNGFVRNLSILGYLAIGALIVLVPIIIYLSY